MKINAAVTFTCEMSLAILIKRSNKYINLAFWVEVKHLINNLNIAIQGMKVEATMPHA